MSVRFVPWFACMLAVAALAQQAARPVIEDKRGRFKVWGILSAGLDFEQGGFKFAASGSPVRLESLDQGIEASCRNLSGSVVQARGGPMRLRSATMKSDVRLSMEGGQGGKSVVETQALSLDGTDGPMVATLPGAFVLTDEGTSPEGTRTVVLRAPSGTATFDPPDSSSKDPLRKFSVAGPATVRLTNRKSGVVTRDMVVSASRIEYDRGARRMTLSGQVTVEGKTVPEDGPGFEGTMSGLNQVVVTFKEDFTVDRIQAQGAPGTAEVREGGG